jgi:bacteriocin-like protein
MDERKISCGPSAEDLARQLGELLTDDEMENVVGGTAEHTFAEQL